MCNVYHVFDYTSYMFLNFQSIFPHRVSVWSYNAPQDYPVLTVIRQERDILSWQIPLEVDTGFFLTTYTNTSRTLCHPYMDIINNLPKGKRFLAETITVFLSLFQNLLQ